MLFGMLQKALVELPVGLFSLFIHRLKIKETFAGYLDIVVVKDDLVNLIPVFSLVNNFVS